MQNAYYLIGDKLMKDTKYYYSRLIEEKINRTLKSSGAILITGPKFCGKSTTCKRFAKSIIELNDDNLIEIANADNSVALNGELPRMIDEWQTVPNLWNKVKSRVDSLGVFGQYILTGSATPADNSKIHHSGSGRITPIIMRPMSLFESKDSIGKYSIKEMFDEKDIFVFDSNENHSLIDTAFYICRGGWPLSIQKDRRIALDVTRNYYEGLFNFKNSENKKYRNKNPEIVKMLLKSYARNISSEASYQTIMKDVMQSNSRNMNIKTFDAYLDILHELFLVDDLLAWCPNIRSKSNIRTTPTRHFVDPSLACLSLNISPEDLLIDANTFGLFFEDLAVRDLRIYSESIDGEIRHYRDSSGLECDAVIHLRDGRWAPIEIKLGSQEAIELAAKNLIKLINNIDEKYSKPSFAMILTATGKAYRRNDGIYVIPINLLRN